MRHFVVSGVIQGVGEMEAILSVEDDLFHEGDFLSLEELLSREYMRQRFNPARTRGGGRDRQRPHGVIIKLAYEVSDDFVTEFGARWPLTVLSGE